MSQDKRIDGSGESGNALEALVNVLYLIRHDRHQPDRVLELVSMADLQVERMAQIFRGDSEGNSHNQPSSFRTPSPPSAANN
jgi:hypothetical protein